MRVGCQDFDPPLHLTRRLTSPSAVPQTEAPAVMHRTVVLDDSGEESEDDDDAGLRQAPRGAEMRTSIDLTRDGA